MAIGNNPVTIDGRNINDGTVYEVVEISEEWYTPGAKKQEIDLNTIAIAIYSIGPVGLLSI